MKIFALLGSLALSTGVFADTSHDHHKGHMSPASNKQQHNAHEQKMQSHSGTEAFNRSMQDAVIPYLVIQEALANDKFKGIAAEAQKIITAAKKVDPKLVTGEHAGHYKDIPNNLQEQGKALAKAKDISEGREVFKKLSQPFAMWVGMAKPENLQVVYCPMAKASWLQKKGTPVANPYLTNMPKCGNII